jgi:hypothetical protein
MLSKHLALCLILQHYHELYVAAISDSNIMAYVNNSFTFFKSAYDV